MYSLIIVYFILSIFSSYMMRHEKNILACGLVGFYPKKNKKVDLTKLYPLWILNEERGTHSSGISYGPTRSVGVGAKSKARDLISDIHLQISNTDLTNMPIICHTRHATNGTHSEGNAHPFRWHRGTEDEFFTFAHNGVIRDLYTFKKTLGMSRHSESLMTIDSQVLGLAMYDAYTKILTEEEILTQYEGNAAFLCYDRNNVFKVWKGANLGTEERPLYYVETKEGWYFCSISIGLQIVFLQEPILVPNNTLLTFANHKLLSSVVYERNIAPVFTAASTTSTTVNNNFKQLVAGANNNPNKKTTGLKVLDNVLKLTLSNVLKKSNSSSRNNNSIILDIFGITKGKYCLDLGLETEPLHGTKMVKLNNGKPTPEIANAGRIFTFENGVIVQPGSSYKQLQEVFEALDQQICEDIFNILYDRALKTVVDFIPLYRDNNLFMIIYKDGDNLNYITALDNIPLILDSILGIKFKVLFANTKHTLYLNIIDNE